MIRPFLALALLAATASTTLAQPLGTFRWQTQPFCNVLTLTVTQTGDVYTLDGFDDQCGAATRAPLTGVAAPNPDGTIGLGMNVVTAPGGRGTQVEARISAAGLNGPWTDAEGNSGTFAFGTSTGGNRRPMAPVPVIPPAITLRADGGFLAGGAPGVGAIPASGPGSRMMWYAGKAAFRAGSAGATEWNDAAIGTASAAFGVRTTASGAFSLAAGSATQATGADAVAFGDSTLASGPHSAAFGIGSRAEGFAGVAIGMRGRALGAAGFAGGIDSTAAGEASLAFGTSLASGKFAVAVGSGHDAAGESSVALGSNVTTTAGAVGTFVYGDRSSFNQIQAFLPNQFKVRAAGGTFFYSNPALSAGVVLAPGANAWSSLSDVHSKENFRDLDDDDVLARVARMPVREWNYKAQDAAVRHMGPTAQDFHGAFGLGEDPLRISTIDADGVALRAIQALEARTREAHASALRENAALRASLEALQARLSSLEQKDR